MLDQRVIAIRNNENMDKALFFVLLPALLYTCNGFAVFSGASWPQSSQPGLKRQARDVAEATQSNHAAADDRCEGFYTCLFQGRAMETLGKVLQFFDLSEVYPNADLLCDPLPNCRIDGCNSREINATIELYNNVFRWICNNQTGFRDAADCFQDPFPSRMASCFRTMRNGDMGNMFQTCVHSQVAGLSAPCTEGDKTFFLSFFDYVLQEQRNSFNLQ